MEALSDYMEVRGLGRDPAWWPAQTPLIATLGGGLQHVQVPRVGLSQSALYRLLRKHFQRAAREMEAALDAGRLMAASTHWLRHTHATHALEAGAAIEEVQENLGHASPATTAIYSHTGRHRRKAAVEKLMAFGTGSGDAGHSENRPGR
jgi:integrase